MRNRIRNAALVVAAALALTACAGSDEPEAIMDVPAGQPSSDAAEVIGQGTVIEQQGEPVQICLGPITMIYPPDCGGPEVLGWDWDDVDGAETEGGTTWGTYAVQGAWDGERLTVTQPPIMLALYDPMMVEDPQLDPDNAGTTSEERLAEIQQEFASRAQPLVASVQNGYLFIEVVHDDGTLQDELDAEYGEGVIAVRSQLRAVEAD